MPRSSGVGILFAAAAAGIAVYSVTFAVLGALLAFPEMQARLQMDAAQKGLIFFSLYAGVFVSNVIIGPLIEASGVKPMFIVSAVLVSVALVWFSALTCWRLSVPAAAMLGLGGGSLIRYICTVDWLRGSWRYGAAGPAFSSRRAA